MTFGQTQINMRVDDKIGADRKNEGLHGTGVPLAMYLWVISVGPTHKAILQIVIGDNEVH